MSVHTPDHEPSLFDPKPAVQAAKEPAVQPAKEPEPPLVSSAAAQPEEPESASSDDAPGEEQETPRSDRKRLAEQLDALRKKESELLRALAITDHPDLADAIRTIEARVYSVARADAKLAQGLSKSEARRQEVLTKKLTTLREKRSELDTQIAALEAESKELGSSRLSDFERERQDALQELMVALATHDPALDAAGLDVRSLLPELGTLMPELEAVARTVSSARASA